MALPIVSEVHAAIANLTDALVVVGGEVRPIAESTGRVLAEDLLADRDSPAMDVSAMDGFAVRVSDLKVRSPLPVAGVNAAGYAPNSLPQDSAIRIFTGAPIRRFFQLCDQTRRYTGVWRRGHNPSRT